MDVDADECFLGLEFLDGDAGLLVNFRGCMKIYRGDLDQELAEGG